MVIPVGSVLTVSLTSRPLAGGRGLRLRALLVRDELEDPLADGLDVVGRRGARGIRVMRLEGREDPLVRGDRRGGTLARLQPLLARAAEDVPDDAEHRDEQLVPGGLADELV